MDVMRLIEPNADFAEEIRAYREEFLAAGDSMDGTGELRRTQEPEEWLAHVELMKKPETVPENRVTSTQLIYVREADAKIVGMLQIRHELNDYLRNYGGHIGYSVRPSERRKGYAKAMLRDALPLCRKLGLERVMISCFEGNEGSRKTIISNGGVYDSNIFEPKLNVTLERYWIELK